ncbi:uncharacterized protein B0H18DRAFT_1081322 [Fomitopsis serialis]|uniref:uncharacterized protein n=1 Tax=Fomitopsis serialis TaxID=139415 RepID=UPI0020080FE1|nr:uncharacterized protein B0H18DRAFT_1081322 [Neoantrodia serialis]KAH9937020.1 hypothetical protein B0H18DRAFT_1081322 [Neoantrodia serialis]
MSRSISIPAEKPQNQVVASPTTTTTLHDRMAARRDSIATSNVRESKVLHPVDNEHLRLLILENISQEAVKAFESHGFHVDHHTKAITMPLVFVARRRSPSESSRRLPRHVDLDTAAKAGIPVFNSPFSNSRSVAELVISEVIALSRQYFQRGYEMRDGIWNKQSKGCWEVRGKTLGIVGYGHIGSQLSVLAEALGMRVLFHDVVNIMPLGSARQVEALTALLNESDFVTLHVPELPETTNMITKALLAEMKKGAYLINNARGKVVDIPALIDALNPRRIPSEPGSNGSPFDDQLNPWSSTLRSIPNVILTPHIGGSTEEAQRMIGEEVDLRAITAEQQGIRVCHVHNNIPGVLRQVNEVLSPYNVEKQYSDSKGDVAYLMADIADVSPSDINKLQELINKTSANILTRLLA